MPRNIVVCCDGTNNQFGIENTSIVRIVQIVDRAPAAEQLVYYDPGVGTFPEPGVMTRIGKRTSEIIDLAFATGLMQKVAEAYTFLMNYCQPGDRLFLFGFSRGAYTVRVLAGLLHLLGLMPRGSENMVPYTLRLFGGARTKADYWHLCEKYRRTFARPAFDGDEKRHFPVHFLGLFDSVSSVGWAWNPATYPFTTSNPSVATVRHAISIDERRWFFRQLRTFPPKDNTMQDRLELWFPGVHLDVGGGYPASYGLLWRCPFDWIVGAAAKAGLRIDEKLMAKVAPPLPPDARPWDEPKHESLTGAWWLAELFPKLPYRGDGKRRVPTLGLGEHRVLVSGDLLAEATLRRIREDATYNPPNLSPAFLARVRAMPEIHAPMPYTP